MRDRGEGAADIAFVQAGPWEEQQPSPLALAAIATEPLWILYNPQHFTPRSVADLRGRRVAVGKEGSGTLPVTRLVLQLCGIGTGDIHARPLNAHDALPALQAGDIDAVFMVAVAGAPVIQRAFAIGMQAMNMSNTVAFAQHLPWAQGTTLAQGVISLARNIPCGRCTDARGQDQSGHQARPARFDEGTCCSRWLARFTPGRVRCKKRASIRQPKA